MNWMVKYVTVVHAAIAEATVSFVDDGLGPLTLVALTPFLITPSLISYLLTHI